MHVACQFNPSLALVDAGRPLVCMQHLTLAFKPMLAHSSAAMPEGFAVTLPSTFGLAGAPGRQAQL